MPFLIKLILWFFLCTFPAFNATFLALGEFGFAISGIISIGRLDLKVPRELGQRERDLGVTEAQPKADLRSLKLWVCVSSPSGTVCRERWDMNEQQNITGALPTSHLSPVLKEG